MDKILEPKYKHFLEIESLESAAAGQIFWAGRNYNKRNKTSHYFVVVDNPKTEGYLYAAMLSSSKDYDYILLEYKYFKERYTSEEKFEYPDRETLFAPKKFIKFEGWGPFYLVGELTDDGIKIIKNIVGYLDPEVCRWNKNVEMEKELIKDLSGQSR